MDIKALLEELRFYYPSPVAGTKPLTAEQWKEKFRSLYISGTSAGRDDLIFIVKWLHSEKKEDVEVFRKQSKSLPDLGLEDGAVLWEQSLYLNLLMHEFEYQVVCNAITLLEGTAKIDKTLMSVSQRVYPSTSKQRMDKRKGQCKMVYPDIIFSLDNFQEVFSKLHVSCPGEKFSFQLVASNKDCGIEQTVFIGAVDYSVLIRVLKQKATDDGTLMSRVKQFSRSFKSGSSQSPTSPTRYYITMAGPNSKGSAQVAIYKKSDTHNDSASPASLNKVNNRGTTATRSSVEGASTEHGDAGTVVSSLTPERREVVMDVKDDGGSGGVSATSTPESAPLPSRCPADQGRGNGAESSMDGSDEAPPPPTLSDSSNPLLYANLTYIELPWHSILQDILQQ